MIGRCGRRDSASNSIRGQWHRARITERNTVMNLSNQFAAWIGLTSVWVYEYFFTTGFVLVEIDKGFLRGRKATTWRGEEYFSFKGIPYARPPIGELRFKAPEEEAAWVGVRDAVTHGEVCPQMDMIFNILRGREDCLFLNVYTPFPGDERLPVMVWIHGGMFMLGSGNDELYGPDYFMKAGVVLVTLNYRLGALGFLSTGDDGAPGNAGLKDQVAALRWIRRNIAKFGGDPENVTLFGGSSGGVCAHYHLLSPMSSGLFARVIAQSGSALSPWALSENVVNVTIRLAEALGTGDAVGSISRAFEFLKTIPFQDIVQIQGDLVTKEERRSRIDFLFAPSVEKGVKFEEVFLPDLPLRILQSGNFSRVPFMTGCSDKEGYFFKNELETPEVMKTAIEDTARYVPNDIKDKRNRNDLAKSIRKFYFDNKPIGNENISNFVNLYSDATMVTGPQRTVKLQVKVANSSNYYYVFSYDGQSNLLKFFLNIDCPGAVHGDELGYLFHQRLMFWRTPVSGTSREYVVDTMVRLWTNFAKYGNPTPAGDPLTWQPVTNVEFNFLNISGWDTKADVNPDPERTDFWAKAYEDYSASDTEVSLRQDNWKCANIS